MSLEYFQNLSNSMPKPVNAYRWSWSSKRKEI